MVTLTFPGTEVLELVQHAKAARKHSTGDLGPANPGPGLLFVKDAGIYLMSNGLPGLLLAPGAEDNRVVYAQGYEPAEADGDWKAVGEKIDQAVGGDDFAEFIPARFFGAIKPGDTVAIRLTARVSAIDVYPPVSR